MAQGLVVLSLTLLAAVPQSRAQPSSSTRPHIVIILADDLGWNDVSLHGSDQIPTPNIDALAYNGITLNSHYVPALCTPSRASLLTGKYPTSLGMQHLVILAQEPWGLPLEETLMSEHLRRHGYSTHAVGKWHLGFHKKAYTPLRRGFDSFFGYYNGYHDYYDHTMEASDQDVPQKGYDMRRGLEVDFASLGKYSTDAFTDEAVHIIHSHNNTQGPLFLYLAHLAPHAGNSDKPYQAPDEEVAQFSHIADPERRVYAAMVSRLDRSVGQVVTALRSSGKLDNSIILFLSDNGAVTFGVHSNHGSNFPLRGLKESPWEGGVRGVAALWSPFLNTTRRVSNQLMHVSDWLPTLFSAAGFNTGELGDIDGKDLWAALSHDLQSPRTQVFNNYDEIENYSSLRIHQWKYVTGTAQEGEVDDWYGDSGHSSRNPPYDISRVLLSPTNVAINGLLTEHQLRVYPYQDSKVKPLLSEKEIKNLRSSSIIYCGANRQTPIALMSPPSPPHTNNSSNYTHFTLEESHQHLAIQQEIQTKLDHLTSVQTRRLVNYAQLKCAPMESPCLFNLEVDPCEELNLAQIFPHILQRMESELVQLKKSVRKPLNQPGDPLADPALYNGIWTHWCDPEDAPDSDSVIFKLLYDKVADLLFDNILLKIVSLPIFSLMGLVIQAIYDFVLSTLTLITILVSILILTNFMKLSSLTNGKSL